MTTRTNPDRERWCAGALAALPMQTHRRIRRLIGLAQPSVTWGLIRVGERVLPGIDDAVWRAWMAPSVVTPDEMEERCSRTGIDVVTVRDPSYPMCLLGDPGAPAVLFVRGDPAHLARRRVGIIGTRSATPGSRWFARDLGRNLSAAGVCVVSGLARGIDVEAHAGALSAVDAGGCGPAAVVASGPDVVYPPEHHGIWQQISARGVLVSERPPGSRPSAHDFPLRNRILAGLCEVLVVVESRHTGGSMITVREAMKRDITVMAVPGSPRNRASEGSNDLIRDGCAPVTCPEDVLTALGLDTRRTVPWCDTRIPPEGDERTVFEVLVTGPRTTDEICVETTLGVVRTAVMLGRLESKGWVAHSDGWWEALVR